MGLGKGNGCTGDVNDDSTVTYRHDGTEGEEVRLELYRCLE